MGNPFDNHDYESEFNYLMEMFDYPYKEMSGNYESRELDSGEMKRYNFSKQEDMKEFYFNECCGHPDADLHQRVENFLEIFVKTTTYPIFQHIVNAIVWDLQSEMDEIKGVTNN